MEVFLNSNFRKKETDIVTMTYVLTWRKVKTYNVKFVFNINEYFVKIFYRIDTFYYVVNGFLFLTLIFYSR